MLLFVCLQMDLFNLKLQHMTECKFITANDFFPIDYTMIFKVNNYILWVFIEFLHIMWLLFALIIFTDVSGYCYTYGDSTAISTMGSS